MTEQQLQAIMLDLRSRFMSETGATPWDINNGCCGDFTDEVIQEVARRFGRGKGWYEDVAYKATGIEAVDLQDPDDPEMLLGHTAIHWRGRFYDAECIRGVRDWRRLPITRNRKKTRVQVISEQEARTRPWWC